MTRPFPALRQALVVLALFTVAQALYNTTIPLSGDEAYYWVWSHHLQAGYHDHPPGIAVLVAATTRLLGDGVAGVRLAAALCMAGALFFVFLTAREMFGDTVGAVALGLGLVLPAVQVGFTLAVPDAPVVLFWAAGVHYGRRAVAGEGRWRDFLLAGLAAGLALDSKYTGVLLPGAIAAFVLLRRPRLLAGPRLWAAVAAAAAAFAPVVWWNWHHAFDSFVFQFSHGANQGAGGWRGLAEFAGGQAAVLSPVLFGLLVWCLGAWRRWWGDDGRLFLVACCLLPLAFFLDKALSVKVQLNWSVPAFVSAVPLLAEFVVARRLARAAWAGVAVALVLGAAVKWPLAFGLTGKLNPQNRLFGPDVAAAAVEELRRPGDAIFADHLQRASLLAFYLPGHPRVHIPTESRFSEYTRWDSCLYFPAMHGLYLSDEDKLAELRRIFPRAELVREVTAEKRGFRPARYFLYRVGPAVTDGSAPE